MLREVHRRPRGLSRVVVVEAGQPLLPVLQTLLVREEVRVGGSTSLVSHHNQDIVDLDER